MFGHINSIDRLAGGDVTKWAAAMSVSFNYGITKLCLDMEKQEFEKRLFDIKQADRERANPGNKIKPSGRRKK